jgi:hypothetical protein
MKRKENMKFIIQEMSEHKRDDEEDEEKSFAECI